MIDWSLLTTDHTIPRILFQEAFGSMVYSEGGEMCFLPRSIELAP